MPESYIPPLNNQMYQYSFKTGIERRVFPKDVCAKKYLYELRDEKGNIIESSQNFIEKTLGVFESHWGIIIPKIRQRTALSDEEMAFLCFLIPIQMLRTPTILNATAEWLQKYQPSLTSAQSNRYIRIMTLMPNVPNLEKTSLLYHLTGLFSTKQITVFYPELSNAEPFLLNGDYPVIALGKDDSDINKAVIIFPIASDACLIILPTPEKITMYTPISNKLVLFLNKQIFLKGGTNIYSSASIKERLHKYE